MAYFSASKGVRWSFRASLGTFLAAVFLSGCSLVGTNAAGSRDATGVGFSSNAVLASLGWRSVDNERQALIPPKEFPSVTRKVTPLPPVNVTLNQEVRRELDAYLIRHRYGLSDALERRAAYLPMMEEIFQDEGLPLELLALPIVESGFNRNARSPVGAKGLWQFMPATARMYGLRVDRKVDERTDPVLSTMAAARFLRDLYEEHGDWNLALAAYNAGSGGVSRALARTGTSCYWTLVRSNGRGLTTQTERFVPKFMAAALIARRGNRFDAVELAADRSLVESLADSSDA